MSKIVKGIVLISIFVIGLSIGLNINGEGEKAIRQVIKESNNNYYVEEGEQIIEFTDGSYIICDLQGNILD